jgi:tRNA(Ile)-lysidine synthase
MPRAVKELLRHVQRALEKAGVDSTDSVVVAASGGLDSTALLHLLHETGRPLVVAHVDHGMRGEESTADRDFVAQWAAQHGQPLEVLELPGKEVEAGPQGFQGEARKRRLAWLEHVRQAHGSAAVLTGHHADDQAETWLLHAMRSPDPLAVHGMALRENHVVRPLLGVTRAEIHKTAQEQGWTWREDASNASSAYLRNRIRHEVLPLLDDLRPGTKRHLQALAERSADMHLALTPLVEAARRDVETTPGKWDLNALQRNPLAREAFRRTLGERGWSHAHASHALRLAQAQVGAKVHGPDAIFLRERDHIAEFDAEENSSSPSRIHIDARNASCSGAAWTSLGALSWGPHLAPKVLSDLSLQTCWIPTSWCPVALRPWQEGDRIQPLGMKGHSLVSDVLTQSKVPHNLRHGAWVLERSSDARVLWVAGQKLSEQARLHLDQLGDTPGLLFTFEPSTTP